MYIRYPFINDNTNIVSETMAGLRPNDAVTFMESAEQGFREMPIHQAFEWIQYKTAGQEGPPVDEETFLENPYYRKGFSFKEGETEEQLRIRAEVFDRNLSYNNLLKNVGTWDGYRIGGFLFGSLIDPISFIPMGTAVSRFSQIANAVKAGGKINMMKSLGQNVGKIARPGTEAAMYAGLANAIIVPKKKEFQEEYGWSDGFMDIAFAFGGGTLLGNFGTVAKSVSNLAPTEKLGNMFNAVRQTGNKQRVNVSENPRGSQDVGGGQEPPPKSFEEKTKENENIFTKFSQKLNEFKESASEEITKTKLDPSAGEFIDHTMDALTNVTENLQDFGRGLLRAVSRCGR